MKAYACGIPAFSLAVFWIVTTSTVHAVDGPIDFSSTIVPILQEHCIDCHSQDNAEGNLSFEAFTSTEQSREKPELWWRVLKNVRAGVMPPNGNSKLSDEQLAQLVSWVKKDIFDIRIDDVDPGRTLFRRLNRIEYGHTVSDLMGIPFDATILFPPDDSGHGFDNVSDALSFSPLLMEKYLKAAKSIVDQAVPTVTWVLPRQDFTGNDFKTVEGKGHRGKIIDGKMATKVRRTVEVKQPGKYRIALSVKQHGSFDFDPARYEVTFSIDGETKKAKEYGWDENKLDKSEFIEEWTSGDHTIEFALTPISIDNESKKDGFPSGDPTHVHFEIYALGVEGPLDTDVRVHPANYKRFFPRDDVPENDDERRAYAREVLTRFTQRAFRGPVTSQTIERLVKIAESRYSNSKTSFESGIAEAMASVLASPRFLFRMETPIQSKEGELYGPTDEWTLASRLSYFLWSTMPDEELIRLAERGELRANLQQQIARMMNDERSKRFTSNFVGQWLRTRDVTQTAIDPLVVLGYADEMNRLRETFRGRFRRRPNEPTTPQEEKDRERFRELREIVDRFSADLKRSMRRETEMQFEYIASENRSLLEMLDCNYTFLNERLARHYGIDGVRGDEMRRVELPTDSPRGGVLTHASMLLVTSNPTRTSPVKRGLFVLDNILGTPAPPAPGVVPELEESGSKFKDKEPTLRELLAAHRESALCASCHSRMDPLGFALENFNALGMWRIEEKGLPIDPSGRLISGEEFQDIRTLKKILREQHAEDFYRCIAEKMLTYAIGRGVEVGDEHSVDLIVDALKKDGGRFQTLLEAVILSAPFQKQRYLKPQ